MPAQQCFKANQFALCHIDLGLITEAQLLPTNGLGQKLLQGQLAMQGLLHAGGKPLPAQASHLLGLIHGHVGASNEGVTVIRIVRVDGDAYAAAYGHFGHTAQLQRFGHLGEHEIGYLLRPVAGMGQRHQGGKLVAAETR